MDSMLTWSYHGDTMVSAADAAAHQFESQCSQGGPHCVWFACSSTHLITLTQMKQTVKYKCWKTGVVMLLHPSRWRVALDINSKRRTLAPCILGNNM